eukprot:Amastigsp_a680902_11.p3 type:complete len:149 gc:universal Amastigsp_a680902_11:139-585(+)
MLSLLGALVRSHHDRVRSHVLPALPCALDEPGRKEMPQLPRRVRHRRTNACLVVHACCCPRGAVSGRVPAAGRRCPLGARGLRGESPCGLHDGADRFPRHRSSAAFVRRALQADDPQGGGVDAAVPLCAPHQSSPAAHRRPGARGADQ